MNPETQDNIIDIYIPRILGNLNITFIKNVFKTQEIGNIIYSDLFRKYNENNYPYYFGFLTVELFSSSQANGFMNKLFNMNSMRLIYDEEANHYWEVKKYIPREKRSIKDVENIKNTLVNRENIKYTIKNNDSRDKNMINSKLRDIFMEEKKESKQDNDYNLWTYCFDIMKDIRTDIYISEQDKFDLVKDYEDLEKIIYYNNNDVSV